MQQTITAPIISSYAKISKINAVFITDENIFTLHKKLFSNRNMIVLKAGEVYKTQATINSIIEQLIAFGADKTTILVGVGGGVITDITGFAASIYMRGIAFGFVPTTLLAMVDASIGGKNGVNVGIYKNMIGNIQQPQFIINDSNFLKTLPLAEWQNGFAEIIKHACIKDAAMFKHLQQKSVQYYQSKKKELELLIAQNANIKLSIVRKDVLEKGDRKLLNFGHTLGHALENQYELSHGEAISIGMNFACKLSAQITGFKQTAQVVELLNQYGLPTNVTYNKTKVLNALLMDKKKELDKINFIVLQKIGKATIELIKLTDLEKLL